MKPETQFKQLKIAGPDISELGRICPVTRNFTQQKSRSGSKTMCPGLDKLTNNKLDNIELREITGATRSNLNSRNQT
jgi:hypothetical protein